MSATPPNYVVVPAPQKAPPQPALPSPTDAQAWTSYLLAIFGAVVGILATFHVKLPVGSSSIAQELAMGFGYGIAAISTLVNLITHRSAHKAAVLQGVQLTGTSGPTVAYTPPAVGGSA